MIVGLTGGIGSGKSTVARYFQDLGVPVYFADDRAKALMNSSKSIRERLERLLGNASYQNDVLNRAFVASKIFKDENLRLAVNAIVHPAVAVDFEQWRGQQEAPYVLKEAAILFENGSYRKLDFTILVTAPRAERIERVKARDKVTEAQVLSRMRSQWSDAKKVALADAVIVNMTLQKTQKKVRQLHVHLLRRIQQNW